MNEKEITGEKLIETKLCEKLRKRENAEIVIANSTSDAHNLHELVCGFGYDVFQDTNEWNTHPKFMQDIIGGMTPDCVLRSKVSSQNRILIEVKNTEELGRYPKTDSQIIRYFLHLTTTSERRPHGQEDIRRAVLLAAPPEWFRRPKNADYWEYFLEKFGDLAKCFDITLGEIHCVTPQR